MKPKSPKLKLLVTLQALFKLSDKDHRMNSVKLSKFLEPYGMNVSGRSLGDTVSILRELGVDVRQKGEWDSQGIWIENRPLSTDKLNALIFAISTNPHIKKEMADEILSSLSPFVTVYQEPLLKSIVETVPEIQVDQDLFDKYMVVQDAIVSKRRLRYTLKYLKYHKETKSLEEIEQWPTLFTPKYIFQKNKTLYMFGFNNTDKRVDIVDVKNIANISIAFKHKDPLGEEVNNILKKIHISKNEYGNHGKLIYKGPAVFKCRGQYANNIYRMFGLPSDSVNKTARGITTYPLDYIEIWPETLLELNSIPNKGVRIVGPEELKTAIKEYYMSVSNDILDPYLPPTVKEIKK